MAPNPGSPRSRTNSSRLRVACNRGNVWVKDAARGRGNCTTFDLVYATVNKFLLEDIVKDDANDFDCGDAEGSNEREPSIDLDQHDARSNSRDDTVYLDDRDGAIQHTKYNIKRYKRREVLVIIRDVAKCSASPKDMC